MDIKMGKNGHWGRLEEGRGGARVPTGYSTHYLVDGINDTPNLGITQYHPCNKPAQESPESKIKS